MAEMMFDEKTLLDGNIFQYEGRLKSFMNKYVENGAILTTYYTVDELQSTVDRGSKAIDELFGKSAPLRYKKILDFPLYSMHSNNPEDVEEINGARDIGVEGDILIIPGTLIPSQYDFFTINHLKMTSLFEITSVTQDSMKVDGYYKLHYRLYSTTQDKIDNLEQRCTGTYHTQLNMVGSDRTPVIREEDHLKRKKIITLLDEMISLYKDMYYNRKHNCMLFEHDGETYFDRCGNEFLYRNGLMNVTHDTNVVMLNDKLDDPNSKYIYNLSIYKWLEMGASPTLIQRFPYMLLEASGFHNSSFNLWGDGHIKIIQPTMIVNGQNINPLMNFTFSSEQINMFMDSNNPPIGNQFNLLLWKFIYFNDTISLDDISDAVIMPLINSAKYEWDTFFFVPIVIYIINTILNMK